MTRDRRHRARAIRGRAGCAVLFRCCGDLGWAEGRHDLLRESIQSSSGVAETGVPNFVYRWTEREVLKTIATFDPSRKPTIEYLYDMRIPIQRFARSGNQAMRAVGTVIEPLSCFFAIVLPSQCNEFAFAIVKSGELQPWARR